MTKLTVTAAKAIKVGNAKHELVVVPLFTNQAVAGQSAAVDAAAGGVLQRAIDMGEAEAKLGKVTSMIGTESVARIIAVGCGDREKFGRDAQLAVTGAIGRSLAASKAKAATIVTDNVSDDADSAASFLEFLARDVAMGCYHYTATVGSPKPGPALAKLSVAVGDILSAAKAKEKFPGSSISLDALCKRYKIDNSKRAQHTALIDCDLLIKTRRGYVSN